MLCPVCGCQLSAITAYCAKCGSKVEAGAPAPSQEETGPVPKKVCVSCGHPCDPSDRFCYSCGRAIERQPETLVSGTGESPIGSTGAAAQLQPETPSATLVPALQPFAPPYAQFAILALTSSIALSVIAFNIGDSLARKKWNSTPSTAVAALCAAALLALSLWTWGTLSSITIGESERPSRKKLLVRSTLFGVLFIVIALGLGAAIGTSGAETDRFIADIRQMSSIGTRIGNARNSAAGTVPAQIAMYKSVEADVIEWDSVLRKLRTDAEIYDQKYPAQQEGAKILKSVDIGLKRAEFLRRQIALAKQIEALAPDAQWNAWQSQMQPIIDQENALDAVK
jgi:hypothetical protein